MILERLSDAGEGGMPFRAAGKERSFAATVAESLLFPAACLALSLWLRPRDPFFLSAAFPWIWLAPWLVALRYGSAGALFASLALIAGWGLSARGYPVAPAFPKGYFLGGFIAAFFCGEFRDLWRAEIRRERKAREQLGLRLDETANAQEVLAYSHERLLSDFIGHPPTLRDALAEVPKAKGGGLDAESAQALLVFLARFFQLETASLHLMEKDGLRAAPLAALGPARRLDGSETLIAACLRSRSLCHALADGETPGPYLFAAPLAAAGGPVLAVLAAEKMPFFAFQEENLRGLSAVLGHYADAMAADALAAPVLARWPDCPAEFAAGYLRWHRLRAEAGVPSVLAARIVPPGASARDARQAGPAADGAAPARRGADLAWKRAVSGGGESHILLLPFCGEEQARVALARLGAGAGEARIASLTRNEPVAELAAFLDGLGGLETTSGPVARAVAERHP